MRRVLSLALFLIAPPVLAAVRGLDSNIERPVVSGDAVYFVAMTDANGIALFRTDGTSEGTVLVADPEPGAGSKEIGPLVDRDGVLFFAVQRADGAELWRADGRATSVVFRFGRQSIRWIAIANGRVLVLYGDDKLAQLWSSDGTTPGTVHLRTFSTASDVAVADHAVYFGATAFRAGSGVWRSDGTVEGTTLVFDTGAARPPTSLFAFRDFAIFENADRDLWRVGGGQPPLRVGGRADGHAVGPDAFYVFAWAYLDFLLFRSTGGVASRVPLPPDLGVRDPLILGQRFLFIDDGVLHAIDASGTVATLGAAAGPLVRWADRAVFRGAGGALWTTNGTPEGTETLAAANSPTPLIAVGDTLLFTAVHPRFGRELWAVDAARRDARFVANVRVEAVIQGEVVRDSDGTAVAGEVQLHRLDANAWSVDEVVALDENGRFRIDGVPPGMYALRTANRSGLIDQVTGGRSCAPCTLTGSRLIEARPPNVYDNVFRLRRGGIVAGRVTDAVDGKAIPGVVIILYSREGAEVTRATSNASGAWRTAVALSEGTYFAFADAPRGWVDEVYDDCAKCSVTSSTPIIVSSDSETTIDFALRPLPRIQGVVRAAATGLPIAAASVSLRRGDANYQFVKTNPDGTYVVEIPGSGTWDLHVSHPSYENVGRTLTLANETVVVADFELRDRTGSIGGRLVDGITREPVRGATITITGTSGTTGAPVVVTSDADGRFSASGLPQGNYGIRAIAPGYLSTPFEDPTCQGCFIIPLGGDSGRVVDFGDVALQRFSVITGTITATPAGRPLQNVTVRASPFTAPSTASAVTDAAGRYSLLLAPGMYFLRVDAARAGARSTDRTVEALPQKTVTFDVALQSLEWIEGHVVDARTGAPLHEASIEITSAGERIIVSTDAAGRYATPLPAPRPVNVVVRRAGYARSAWNGHECGRCVGEAIEVGRGERVTADFALHPLTTVSGRVIDAVTGAPLRMVDVAVVDANGEGLGGTRTDQHGRYTTALGTGLAYFVVASERIGLRQQQFWPAADCDACVAPPPSATPIRSTTPVTGVDFALDIPLVNVRFTLTLDGRPFAGAGVELYAPGGPLALRSETTSDAGGVLDLQVRAGTYFVKSWNTAGRVDGTTGGLACPISCDVTRGGALIVLPGSDVQQTLELRTSALTEVFPRVGPAGAFQRVRLYGGGFGPGVRVQFGGNDAAVASITRDVLEVVTPPRVEPGLVDVVVSHPDGTRNVLPAAYRYAERGCAPLDAVARSERDVGFAWLIADVRGGGPATVQWFYGRRGDSVLVRMPGAGTAIVPLAATAQLHTVRVTSDCEDRELVIEVEPFAKRRAGS